MKFYNAYYHARKIWTTFLPSNQSMPTATTKNIEKNTTWCIISSDGRKKKVHMHTKYNSWINNEMHVTWFVHQCDALAPAHIQGSNVIWCNYFCWPNKIACFPKIKPGGTRNQCVWMAVAEVSTEGSKRHAPPAHMILSPQIMCGNKSFPNMAVGSRLYN